MHRRSRLVHGAMVTGIALALAGCNRPPSRPQEDKAAADLRKILQAYDLALMTKRRAPRDLEDLKTYLKQLAPENELDADLWLRSPNDGQTYEVIYGVNLERGDAPPNAILAHEKKGALGKRYVITVARITKVMSEAEFSAAEFAKGSKPPPDK